MHVLSRLLTPIFRQELGGGFGDELEDRGEKRRHLSLHGDLFWDRPPKQHSSCLKTIVADFDDPYLHLALHKSSRKLEVSVVLRPTVTRQLGL